MTDADLKGKNLVDLLAMLQEIPVPDPVPMWPQTPAWAVVAALLIAATVAMTRRIAARRQAEAYRKAALAELAGAGDDPARIAALLRRAALAAYPRDQVAGLHGPDWLGFLDDSFPGSGFRDGPGQVLATAAYRDTPPCAELTGLARDWIRTHVRGGGD